MRERPLQVRFEKKHLVLVDYPFLRRNRGRAVPVSMITEIVPSWSPPCVRTSQGEFLFVPAEQREGLDNFARRVNRPRMRRVDLWSYILQPFLDSKPDDADERDALRKLAEQGVTEEEVKRMRRLVQGRMLAMTVGHWEWDHYGLYDVLEAMRPATWTTGWTFPRFYRHAMKIADCGAKSRVTEHH